jgi:hypothetical protein
VTRVDADLAAEGIDPVRHPLQVRARPTVTAGSPAIAGDFEPELAVACGQAQTIVAILGSGSSLA